MRTVTKSQREFKGRRDDVLLGESGRALRSKQHFSQAWKDERGKGILGY